MHPLILLLITTSAFQTASSQSVIIPPKVLHQIRNSLQQPDFKFLKLVGLRHHGSTLSLQDPELAEEVEEPPVSIKLKLGPSVLNPLVSRAESRALRRKSPVELLDTAEQSGLLIARLFYHNLCTQAEYELSEIVSRCAQYFILFYPEIIDEVYSTESKSNITTLAPPLHLPRYESISDY